MWTDEVSSATEEKAADYRVTALRDWWSMRQCTLALENTSRPGFDCASPNQILRRRLWIGDFIGAEKLDTIPEVKAIVSLHKDPIVPVFSSETGNGKIVDPYWYPEGRVYDRHHIAIEDSPFEDIFPLLIPATDFMHDHMQDGRGVYVHCQAGISRSATICIAYLIRFGRMTLDQAYTAVYCVRPIICPNHAFIRQLQLFEKHYTQ
jgi:protein-tyrosine phosphatase